MQSVLAFSPRSPSAAFEEAARARQAELTKPAGSLGRLEELAVWLAARDPEGRARSRPCAAVLFASDHPVAARGVSAYPREVTAAMTANFVRGGAAASVAARHLGVPLHVVDVGVAHPYPNDPAGELVSLVRDPVADMDVGDLTEAEALAEPTLLAAVGAGRRAISVLEPDTRVVILGEMGIGNTTVAATVAGALLGLPADAIVGAGTGVDAEGMRRKHDAVSRGLARIASGATPWDVLRAVGGRDVAALVGAAGEAASRGMTVLVDGFIVSVAMLCLVRAEPRARASLVFAHRSREQGHGRVLDALDARPLLDLDFRLGEGSGALAALPLLDLACALHGSMATFAEARVPDRAGDVGERAPA